jgi:uncharacterized protein (TIGR02466 family)
MNIFPIFATGLGVEKAPEGLPFARKVFAENKNLIKPLPYSPNYATTLRGYKRNNIKIDHKNTSNLEKLKKTIYEHAFKFFVGCGYDGDANDLEVVNIWLNEIKSGAPSTLHAHYGYQISGCFYVDVPKDASGIMFTNTNINLPFGDVSCKAYTIFNSASWEINPQEGDMYFWRSDLGHYVAEGNFTGIRRSIAFDINVIAKLKEE